MSRTEAKQRTRERLLESTLEVLLREGEAKLTTGRVAQAAGVAQPTFYVHFSDMNEALAEAAEQVTRRVRERLRAYREDLAPGSPREAMARTFASSLRALTAEPRMAALFLRHRRDASSPLGACFGEVVAAARADLRDDLTRLGFGADAAVFAELLVGTVLGAAEGLVDGRVADAAEASDALARVAEAILLARAGAA